VRPAGRTNKKARASQSGPFYAPIFPKAMNRNRLS